MLARLKSLRGSALDVFGYTTERKMERALRGRIFGDDLPPPRHQEPIDLPRLVALRNRPIWCAAYGHIKKPMWCATVRNARGSKAPSAAVAQAAE